MAGHSCTSSLENWELVEKFHELIPSMNCHPERTGVPSAPAFGAMGWGSEGSAVCRKSPNTADLSLFPLCETSTKGFFNKLLELDFALILGIMDPPAEEITGSTST
jgi:hypothetical protein